MTNIKNKSRLFCPDCGDKNSYSIGTVFVEQGDYCEATQQFECEGDAPLFKCETCKSEFIMW